MEAKELLQALKKAVKNFEEECKKSGKIIEKVSINFTSRYATLRGVIEDNETGDDFIMTQYLWFYSGEIEAGTVEIFNY